MNDFQTPSTSPGRAWKKPLAVTMVAGVVLLAVAWQFCQSRLPVSVALQFSAVVDDQPLVLNQLLYPNPGGDGSFKIRSFQFYLSNITLHSEEGDYKEPASYHLVRFDNDSKSYHIQLTDVPRKPYTSISFALGVDPQANGSIDSIGDLDPNGRMAWNWEVGYKFILFEGGLQTGDTLTPLVYHVGFDENYRPLAFELNPSRIEQSAPGLQFTVDIMKLFTGSNRVDMASLSNVKFDRDDARRIADNYAHMISQDPP